MARFVPDSKTGRWVIIAPARVSRPHDNTITPEAEQKVCPFCPGQEKLNKELFSIGSPAGEWQVRVIANKYPITDFHEVVIHSPDHNKDIDELPLGQAELILKTYRQRFNYHTAAGNGHVLIFNNHDVHAGASIKHPHSQLVVVPNQVNLDVISKEPINNVVTQTKWFTVYCPDFSQWPYEVWVTPTETQTTFGEISDSEITDLAPILQKTLAFIVNRFRGEADVPYNYYIYHGADWYLRIIPRLVHRAGFELGTGLSVNIVDPEMAAGEYRESLSVSIGKFSQ